MTQTNQQVQIGCGRCMQVTPHETNGWTARCAFCDTLRDYGGETVRGDRGGLYVIAKVGGFLERRLKRQGVAG